MDKIKMLEMMGKLNPGFIINEDIVKPSITTQANASDYRLQTYGDLKKIINVIKLKQKGSKLAGVGLDILADVIPGLNVAKTTYEVLRAAFGRPDSKKTNTWLDKLDIDDDTSKIVDDNVENGFLQAITKMIDSQPDDKKLEPDFNMNDKLSEYLKTTYNDRTVIGYK